MTTNNEERVRGFVGVYADRHSVFIEKTKADAGWHESTVRVAEVVELRPGETIVTREMREALHGLRLRISANPADVRELADSVLRNALDILDGKDGA